MTHQCTVKKDEKHAADALWWKPVFKLQKKVNHSLTENFSYLLHPSFLSSPLWDAEENMFTAMQHNTHQLFSELFNTRQKLASLWSANAVPSVDIIENGKSFKIKANVPGLHAKDLEVTISDCAITISGETCEESEDKGDNYLRRECNYGEFSRTIALPENANVDQATASVKDNVLTIEIPKKEQAKAKTRKVKVEDEKANLSSPSFKSSQKPSENKGEKEAKPAAEAASAKPKAA